MTRKEARGVRPSAGIWKIVSLAAGAAVVLGTCLAARQFWGPGSANAQQPAGRQPAAPVTRGPSAQPSAAVRPSGNPGANAAVPQTAPKLTVMAVVNGEEITREQLGQECLRRYGSDVLESIVNKHLIWQECQRRGIMITDQDVEEEIARVSSKFGLAPDRWLAMLVQERDITPNQYRREIIWPTLALRHLAAKEIEVTPQELQEAMENEFGAKVKVRLIAVGSKEKAEQIRTAAAANPESFGDLAKKHSEDPSASVEGMIPPIRKHMGVPEVELAAFSLKEGEISSIVQVANQFLILKCERQIPATYIADQFRQDAEQRLGDRIRDQKMRTAAADLFQRLQQGAQVVNVYNDPQLRTKMPGVAATINGQQIPIHQLAEECLVRHGEEVLDGEVNRVMLTQALRQAGREVAKSDIDAEIARAAESYGYVTTDGKPDISAWLKKVTEEDGATVDLYVRDVVWPTVALKQLVNQDVQVSDEDLQRGFEANYGPRVEILAMVLSNQRQAQRVWEMARANPTDQFFGELAAQYSVDPISKENLGKVPPIRRFGGQPLLEEHAFALKAGEMSGIIAVGDKFVILRCQGRTEPVVKEMDDSIRQELTKEIYERKLRTAMAEAFDSLMEKANITNYMVPDKSVTHQARQPLPAAVR